MRLKNIHLTNQLKRIEQTLRQKEELAEGLHLIDFEQLKIENQVKRCWLPKILNPDPALVVLCCWLSDICTSLLLPFFV